MRGADKDHTEKWPTALQTVIVDSKGFVWVAGTGAQDSIRKFTKDGKLVWDFGHRPPADDKDFKENNQNTDAFVSKGRFQLDESGQRDLHHQPAARARVRHDHRRVQARVGRPRDAAERDHQRSAAEATSGPAARRRKRRTSCPTCTSSRSRRTARSYVGERGQNRIEVFTTDGKFLQEFYVSPNTPSQRAEDCGGLYSKDFPPCGTTYKLAISRDPQQKYLYVADGTNDKVWILDRQSGKTLGSFGRQRHLRRPVPLDQCDRDGFEGQHLHGRGRGEQAHPEVRARHGERSAGRFLRPRLGQTTHGEPRRITLAAAVLQSPLGVDANLVLRPGQPANRSSQARRRSASFLRAIARPAAAHGNRHRRHSRTRVCGRQRTAASARARSKSTGPSSRATSQTTSTDADGRYEIKDLPGGRYNISRHTQRVSPTQLRSAPPVRAGQAASTSPTGSVADNVDFTLPRMGLITGRVLDEANEPISGVRVMTMRTVVLRGTPPADSRKSARDDRRCGSAPAARADSRFVLRDGRHARDLDGRRQRVSSASWVTRKTYYPGTTGFTDARRVAVGVGQEANNIDFALIPGRGGDRHRARCTTLRDGLLAGRQICRSCQEFRGPNQMFAMVELQRERPIRGRRHVP